MREKITTALDVVGLALLSIAGFQVSQPLGFAMAGASTLFASWKAAS